MTKRESTDMAEQLAASFLLFVRSPEATALRETIIRCAEEYVRIIAPLAKELAKPRAAKPTP